MAIVKRESGSWKTVTNKLKQAGIIVNTQGDLLQLLEKEKIKHAESIRLFKQKKQEADRRCKDESAQLFAEQENSLSLIRKEFGKKIRPVQDRIDALEKQQNEMNENGLLYKLFNLFKVIKLSSKIKNIRRELKKIISENNDKLKEQNITFDRKRLNVSQLRDDVIYDLKKEIDGTERRVATIEETLKSNDYYGAIAELRMIDFLRKLPDSYYVINDVSIKLNKSIRFDGGYISSVQIDHIVIGLSGVFIIEVKNWSRKFASTGDFFDPYKQVKRHSYACFKLLKDQFEVKSKNIIACANYLSPQKNERHTTVKPIEQVTEYILCFKEQVYDKKTVEQIVKFLEGEINDTPFW